MYVLILTAFYKVGKSNFIGTKDNKSFVECLQQLL